MKKLFLIGIGGAMASVAIFGLSHTNRNAIVLQNALHGESQQEKPAEPERQPEPIKKMETPKVMRAVYLTAPSAGREDKIESILAMKKEGLNAVVIDIKDSYGVVAYDSQLETVRQYKLRQKFIPDLAGVVKRFHDADIYVVARIAVFEDTAFAEARPELAVQDGAKLKLAGGMISKKTIWRDRKNLAWLDPSSKEVHAYVAALSKDALTYGFDELNYDYMRFPSDGKTTSIVYPITKQGEAHVAIMKDFFKYLREQTSGTTISGDMFGFTLVDAQDIGIGQMVEDGYEYFDYVCPMVYPSHYPRGYLGYKNPAAWPYEVVADSIQKGLDRLTKYKSDGGTGIGKLRPWLQDFNLGADYTAPMIGKQIKATQDVLKEQYAGYILWNPSSNYTSGGLR